MPISDHVAAVVPQAVQEAVAEVRTRIAEARARGGHGQDVTLVAVTKTHGPDAVEAAFACGVTDVGENRVQEAESKMAQVTVPVRWHLIGHLQRNKAKQALRFSLVHGMDSERLAVALHDEAAKAGRTLDVLLQVNVSGEASKSGVAPHDVPALADRLHALSALRVRGVMTMAPFDAAEGLLRDVFAGARALRATLQAAGHSAEWLSMGMSGDYEIAVEEGATHVRLGTVLFGSRT
ncbi:YggS family pyridoxal phosphate-dependent enzyme [Gemmatimonas sp.]|uniref:YggS family pyridoxal phosphate-dependent enzyme n=1 Tax=Gemmatimonas sp. TaxID=1962908 RepID=UPI00333F414E